MARSSHTFGLRHRLASAAATFVTLLMVGAVLSIVMINGWSSALERRRTSRAALVEINALQTGYGEQGSGVQGFVLTADRRYLDTFDEGIRRVGSAYQSLSRMTMPGERFDRSIETLRAAGDEWLIAALRPLVASTQAGELPRSEVIEAGRLRYEVLRHQLDSTRSQLDAAVQHAESRSHRFEQLAVTALLFAFGSGLVFAVVILVLIRRWMLDPLRELTIATVAVAHGEPTAIPRPLAEELSIVADAVDFLQRSKSEERDNALRAMQGLEQTAILALRVRSELANEIGTPPPGWDAHCSLRSAEGVVAGDCIDTGLLDSSTMFVVVLDVTGHGATAALHALRAKSLARMGLKSGLQPGEAIELVSRHQRADEHSQYLTAFVALVDLVNGVCRYANAGHPPALLVGPDSTTALSATGPLVGPFDASWRTESVQIALGETLLVHSDGLTEVRGPADDWFGEDRLRSALQALVGADAATIVARLEETVRAHRVGPQSDDVTLLVLQRQGSAAVLNVLPPDPAHETRLRQVDEQRDRKG